MTKGSKQANPNKKITFHSMNHVKYSWLGEWYKIKFDKMKSIGCKHEESWAISHSIEDWDGRFNKKLI